MNFAELLNVTNVSLAMNVIGFGSTLYYIAKKKGLSGVADALVTAERAVEAVEPYLAATSIGRVVHVTEEFLHAAATGARYAEQLFKNDNAVDRKAVATEYATNFLHELGVEITPRVAHILDGAIESAVLWLPSAKKEEVLQSSGSAPAG